MPDLGNPIAGMYPQPPQQQGSLLSNPLQMIGGVAAIQAMQIQRQQFQAQQAIGRAFDSALDPVTHQVNTDKLNSAIAGNPVAAPAAAEGFASAVNLRRGQIASDAAQFALAAGQNQQILSDIGSIANDPNVARSADKIKGHR